MPKYVRVMDGLKSNASGQKFELDTVVEAKIWNPKEKKPEKMGGFNFSTEDKILRYIFRGDTLYDVIIPSDAEVVMCDSVNVPNGVFRANKIMVTNPRKVTEDMVMELYEKSNLPLKTYFQCMYCVLFKGYINVSKRIIQDKVNGDNINEAIKVYEKYSTHTINNPTDTFDYEKMFPAAKEIYDLLCELREK